MYNAIGANKRKTWVLMFFFSVLAVLLVTFLGIYSGLEPIPALFFGLVISIVYALISFYLSDKATLTVAGAKEIDKEKAPDVYRLVENLAISAGVPTPRVYIIDDPSPNAFATGRDPEHASIAMTTGLLSTLNKQELEGVLAHELSHVKNYDIRLMTVIVVLIGLILLVSNLIFRIGALRGNNRGKDGGGATIIILVGIILGLLSPLIAQLIKLSISRTREYMADQSAVMLTRYPEGLAGALEKIRDNGQPLQRANHATAHLYIANPFGSKKSGEVSFFQKVFLTHPPINDRIKKLRGLDV
ncbi:M48 family metallopeptidase [Patescibacteria group bacterium]|nr:M48 family metallopeptidase [Patescibacteria group bacterium]